MRKLRLCVCKKLYKFLDSDGDWDGVYDESYEYIIYDGEGIEVAGMDGYDTEEAARKAGEMRLNELNKRYESKSKSNGRDCIMKKIAVITTSKELKEFQERTDIRILDINVKACDQTWATQEYFVATIVYNDDLSSDPDYWTRLEHKAAIAAMQALLSSDTMLGILSRRDNGTMEEEVAREAFDYAHALVEKYKKEERK